MDYFPHDTGSMKDDRIQALRMRHGLDAVCCYFAILEKVYADEEPVNLGRTDVGSMSISMWLGIGYEQIREYVSTMAELGLLESVEGCMEAYTSRRAEEYIEQIERKRETARQNGKKNLTRKKRKPTRNQRGINVGTDVGTNEEPTSVGIKREKGVGLDKPNQTPTASAGAGAGGPAPRAVGRAEADMAEQRRIMAEAESAAVPCPASVAELVRGIA